MTNAPPGGGGSSVVGKRETRLVSGTFSLPYRLFSADQPILANMTFKPSPLGNEVRLLRVVNYRTSCSRLQRCGKSCRLRWTNYLRPGIKRGGFSTEEDETIIQLHSVVGNRWSAIAARLPGRTDNEVKNYWNTNLIKRLSRRGIDPVTHNPHPNSFDLSAILNSTKVNLLSLLLGLQTLINPEIIKLANSLLLSHTETQELLLHSQNSQGPELLLQNLEQNQLLHNQSSIFQDNNQLHNQVPEIPHCTLQNISCSSSQSMQGNVGPYLMNGQIFQENMMVPLQNYSFSAFDASDNSTVQFLNNNNNQNSQNFSFDTPLSGI